MPTVEKEEMLEEDIEEEEEEAYNIGNSSVGFLIVRRARVCV